MTIFLIIIIASTIIGVGACVVTSADFEYYIIAPLFLILIGLLLTLILGLFFMAYDKSQSDKVVMYEGPITIETSYRSRSSYVRFVKSGDVDVPITEYTYTANIIAITAEGERLTIGSNSPIYVSGRTIYDKNFINGETYNVIIYKYVHPKKGIIDYTLKMK